jgi:hypothetical protein
MVLLKISFHVRPRIYLAVSWYLAVKSCRMWKMSIKWQYFIPFPPELLDGTENTPQIPLFHCLLIPSSNWRRQIDFPIQLPWLSSVLHLLLVAYDCASGGAVEVQEHFNPEASSSSGWSSVIR